MNHTYKERVEQAFRDEVPLSPRELRDLAAEADAQLASKDAEIAQVYAAAGEAQAERDAARDERDALAAEVARLREDAERIDWLQRAGEVALAIVNDAPNDGQFCICSDIAKPGYGQTIREAIDAAMATPKEGA